MRSGCKSAATGQKMVGIAGVGPANCQAIEHAVRDYRGRAKARGHSSPDVGQRDRFPRRIRCEDHATAALKASVVAAAQVWLGRRWVNAQQVEEEHN